VQTSSDDRLPELDKASFTARNNYAVTLYRSESGEFACPVCGCFLGNPPYDIETGAPSMEWCPCCDTQFGWDDIIPPDSPAQTLEKKWKELRETWLLERSSAEDARKYLKNIGIDY
jgi:hypothetical protein